jgi:hypothetical protein
MAAQTALPTAETSSRRWVSWVAVLSLAGLVLLIALHPGLRSLAADTWREMISIPPLSLALIFAFKVGQGLFSALSWRNALLAAWPNANLAYRFVLGVEQGQVAINTVMPARAGTWAMLGIFGMSIRGARAPKLLAVWAVQGLAFSIFAMATYALLAFGPPDRAGTGDGPVDRVTELASDQPLLATGIAAILLVAVTAALFLFRHKLGQAWRQIREGLAILHPPARYLRALFLPSLISWLFSCAAYVVLLDAFGIPVTVWTVALALGSNALAGAVRITPGGLGTSQALDVIALRDYASPEAVTAFSLSEVAISAVVSVTVATVALVSVSGWRGTRTLFLHLHRGDVAARLQTLGERQRALRAQVVQRRRALRARAMRRHRPAGDD